MKGSKQALSILLVSQPSTQSETVQSYLVRDGYQVTVSGLAEAGWQLSQTKPAAAIVLAGSAPGEALALSHQLRLSAGPTFPILLITADARSLEPEHRSCHHADDYLLEPLSREALLMRLSVMLKQNQRAAEKGQLAEWEQDPNLGAFLRLTEAARADLLAGQAGAIALISAAATAKHPAEWLAATSTFLAARLTPTTEGRAEVAPYGSFSLLAYQPNSTAGELADQLKGWREQYRLFSQSDFVAGVAGFPADATNLLELVRLADTALLQAQREGRIVPYQPQPIMTSHQLLIVDDNQEQVEMLELLIKREGYQTLRAYDGEEALSLLEEQAPDLLLLDLEMPRLDGFGVLYRLRDRHGGRLHLPVIMVTANDQEESVLRGFELGARDYIIKPYDPRDLLSRIQSILLVPASLRESRN